MQVHVPSPLRSYTGNLATVEARGATLLELMAELDRIYPGMRFRMIDEQDRIRQHIRLFVNQELAESLEVRLRASDQVHIICALSGGVTG